MTGRSLL